MNTKYIIKKLFYSFLFNFTKYAHLLKLNVAKLKSQINHFNYRVWWKNKFNAVNSKLEWVYGNNCIEIENKKIYE